MFPRMSVVTLVILLVVLGVAAYFANASTKLTPTFKWLINAVILIVAILLILTAFGVWQSVRSVQVPKL